MGYRVSVASNRLRDSTKSGEKRREPGEEPFDSPAAGGIRMRILLGMRKGLGGTRRCLARAKMEQGSCLEGGVPVIFQHVVPLGLAPFLGSIPGSLMAAKVWTFAAISKSLS
jgi:hypothetical protein